MNIAHSPHRRVPWDADGDRSKIGQQLQPLGASQPHPDGRGPLTIPSRSSVVRICPRPRVLS